MVSYSTHNYPSLKKSTWSNLVKLGQMCKKNLYYLVRVVIGSHMGFRTALSCGFLCGFNTVGRLRTLHEVGQAVGLRGLKESSS